MIYSAKKQKRFISMREKKLLEDSKNRQERIQRKMAKQFPNLYDNKNSPKRMASKSPVHIESRESKLK